MKPLVGNTDHLEMEILEQAAEWFAALQDEQVTSSEVAAWQHWLNAKPEHHQAWQRIQALDEQFLTIQSEPAKQALKVPEANRRKLLKGLASLSIVSPIAWLGWQVYKPQFWQADIQTAVGEIRQITLPDGGQLWLNTHTAVSIDFQSEARKITLFHGEIYIETAKDNRPFYVETASGRIRSIGTEFSVHFTAPITQVTVNSGKVALNTHHNSLHEMILESGDSAQFDQQKMTQNPPTQMRNTQWQDGVLIADNMSLSEFLNELSRYRHGIIRYDSESADLTLTGSYPLADTDLILNALAETLPIKISRITPWWISIKHMD